MNWDHLSEDERRDLFPRYERLRLRGYHWGPEGFDMETLERIFESPRWRYQLKESEGGYEAFAEFTASATVIDRGYGEGRLPEIALLRALDVAVHNGALKG